MTNADMHIRCCNDMSTWFAELYSNRVGAAINHHHDEQWPSPSPPHHYNKPQDTLSETEKYPHGLSHYKQPLNFTFLRRGHCTVADCPLRQYQD